jgi:hypothetical protein
LDFVDGTPATSLSSANGNSSLSYAPSTNAGAGDFEGFTPSCLNFCAWPTKQMKGIIGARLSLRLAKCEMEMNRDCDTTYTVLDSARYCMSRLIGGRSYRRYRCEA